MSPVDVVESDVAASQFRCHVGPVKHAGTAATAGATARSGRVPWVSCSVCPRLRPPEQTTELVVYMTRRKDVVSAAASAMCLGRQVPQNAID